MTAPDAFGLAVSGGASMRTLDRVECLEFLPTKKVGRLGYVTDDGPRIVPPPEPWAGGPRTLFLRIPLTTVTGRQVLAP